NQLVWEHDGISTYDGTQFSLPVSGRLTPELATVYAEPHVITAAVNGASTEIPYNDLAFSGTVPIPYPADIYPITFSVSTVRETTLSKVVNVIRYVRPDGELQVRDPQGNEVQVTESNQNDTDGIQLTTGIAFANLSFSAPEGTPVRIQFRMVSPDMENFAYDGGQWQSGGTPETLEYSVATEPGENVGDSGKCSGGFPDDSYCVPLPATSTLKKGKYEITATVCSLHTDRDGEGCVVLDTEVVVDNDLPKIKIETPKDNYVYSLTDPIVIRGTVENYAASAEGACSVYLWVNTPVAAADAQGAKLALSNAIPGFCPVVDGETNGNIDPLETGNSGNIKKGTFEFTVPSRMLLLYTNVIQIRAYDANGHASIKVVSFQRGEFNQSRFANQSGTTADLISGQLGKINLNTGATKRAPLALDISQDLLEREEVIAVIEKLLNDEEDGLKFADIIQGGKLPGDENGNNREDNGEEIDFEKGLDLGPGEDFWDLSRSEKREWIWQNIHGSMPQKVRALTRYRTYQLLRGEAEPGDLENVFFRSTCEEDSDDIQDVSRGWDLACDSCANKFPTGLVSFDTLQYIYRGIYSDPDSIPDLRPEWPDVCGDDLNCEDSPIEQGKWKIGKIELKNNGYIDLDACIVGEGDRVDGCDDVADDNNDEADYRHHKPAFWGHMAAIGLVEGGITGLENDPVLPILWNVGKVRLKLTDFLQLRKVELEDGTWSNKIVVHRENLVAGLNGSIQLKSYLNCADYYHEQFGADKPLPFGCDPARPIYPLVIDRTAPAGEAAWADLGEEGSNPWLLTILRDKLLETFRNMTACMIEEMANPALSAGAIPYPTWVTEENKFEDLTFAIDQTGDNVSFKRLKDAQNPVFTLRPNLQHSDFIINSSKLTLRLPFEIGASGIGVKALPDLSGTPHKRDWGYLFRNTLSNFESINRLSAVPAPDLNLSLGIEEILNSVAHVLWKKGPLKVIDLADSETYDKLGITDNWKLGIDKVILGRFDVCGDLSGLASTDLAPGLLFNRVQDLFGGNSSTHLSLKINRNYPPTLSITPVKLFNPGTATPPSEDPAPEANTSDPNAFAIHLGLTNVRLDAKKLVSNTNEDGETRYSIGCTDEERETRTDCDSPILSLRLDGVIKLFASYDRESRKLKIFVPPLDQMIIYTSVIKNGGIFNDELIIDSLYNTVLYNIFNSLGTVFPGSPTMELDLPNMLSKFNDFHSVKTNVDNPNEFDDLEGIILRQNRSLSSNGNCTDSGPQPYYTTDVERLIVINPSVINLFGNWNNRLNGTITKRPFVPRNCIGKKEGINEIVDSLCDAGLTDVEFSDRFPNLTPDTNNGYLHLSTDVQLIPDPELWEEVSTE
ncbi:MAG: hypothetical protein Q7T11_04500, partial [Deltaproteobacteria bacterium]|nr:hypothetical protein [Deltaproteobacteria bacterium]